MLPPRCIPLFQSHQTRNALDTNQIYFHHIFFIQLECILLLSHQSVVQTVLIQQEIINPHSQHSIIIVIWHRRIFRDDNLLEEIAILRQRALLLFHLCPIRNRISWLDIITPGFFIADKINFQLLADSVTFFIGFIQSNNSHIHIEAAYLRLIENNILHSMGFFQLTKIETGIT